MRKMVPFALVVPWMTSWFSLNGANPEVVVSMNGSVLVSMNGLIVVKSLLRRRIVSAGHGSRDAIAANPS